MSSYIGRHIIIYGDLFLTKKCSRCGNIKPLGDFNICTKNTTDGRAYWCKECVNKHAKFRREQARTFIREYKKTHPCIECGETDIHLLQFHHINPDTKRYCISDMIRQRSGIETIKTEIDKCCVLCVNCHEKVHNGNLDIYK